MDGLRRKDRGDTVELKFLLLHATRYIGGV